MALEITNLSVKVDEQIVIENCSIAVPYGQTALIIGPNGSGKSSLVQAIAGDPRYQIVAGEVKLHGQPIKNLTVSEIARRGLFLGWQHPVAIPGLSVRAFLRSASRALGRPKLDEFSKSVTEALQTVGLSEEILTRSVNDGFSGGEQKRFELAQALIFQARVVILDEIDSGLDVVAQTQLAQTLLKLHQRRRAVLLISHSQKLWEKISPNIVAIMKHGHITRLGDVKLLQKIAHQGFA